jgi:hypothetical protein
MRLFHHRSQYKFLRVQRVQHFQLHQYYLQFPFHQQVPWLQVLRQVLVVP